MQQLAAPDIGDPRASAPRAGSKLNPGNGSAAIRAHALQGSGRSPLFWVLMGYFVLEYVRPPYIVNLRLQFLSLVLLAMAWAVQPIRPWSRNLTLQTAFFALCLLSVTYVSNHFAAYVEVRTMVGNVVIALAVTWLMARHRAFLVGIWIWILIMSYQAVHAILYDGHGTGGFLGDENDVALACCTALPFVLQGTAFFRGWRRWASGAFALLFTIAIVASKSRGGFLGLVALVAYGILVSPNRIRNLAITAAAALVFYASVPASYRAEVASIFENKEHDTGEARVFLWKTAWNMWLDHPVVGVGVGNFNWNVSRYQASAATGRFSSPEYIERDWTMVAVHSLYFTVLSETGLVGSLLFGTIVVGHFSTIRRTRKFVGGHPGASAQLHRDATVYGVGLGAAMVACLTAGAFLSVAYYPYVWMLSALAVAWDRAAWDEIGERRQGPGSEKTDASC